MARIVVTGANGLLGSTLVPALIAQGHDVVRVSRNEREHVSADLTDARTTREVLLATAPDVIVNLVAMTDVDDCERNPQLAYAANTLVVSNLVRGMPSVRSKCHLIQVSTDHLYDGAGPHAEDDVRPINYYAFSKYAGELVAGGADATVLRTNLFGRSRCPARSSFSDWLVSVMQRHESATVFEDVWFSPLSLETLSRMIAIAIDRRIPGTFNLGSRQGMSKAEFAFRLAQCLGLDFDRLVRGTSTQRQDAARRPKDMRMQITRFESTFETTLPTLESEINLMRNAYVDRA